MSDNGASGSAGVIPPPPAPEVFVLEPESVEDARHDAGLHEDVADTILVDLGKVLTGDVLPLAQGRPQILAQVATAEAALAVGFRIGQLSATMERAVEALERIATVVEEREA